MTIRASKTTKLCYFGLVIPHEGEKSPSGEASGEASGDASCSILTTFGSGSSSFTGADLVALFFLAETGLSPEGEAARLRLLGFGVSASAVAGALVDSLQVLVRRMALVKRERRWTYPQYYLLQLCQNSCLA